MLLKLKYCRRQAHLRRLTKFGQRLRPLSASHRQRARDRRILAGMNAHGLRDIGLDR